MARRFELALLVSFFVALSSVEARPQDSVATPAIDTSIFKDGEVESRDFQSGEWYAKCQQIVKIKRRICNLLSHVRDTKDNHVGSVIIATTDAGIPAMMIALPDDRSHKQSISVDASHIGMVDGKAVKVEFSQIVNPMVCDTNCKYMFPLDPKLVFILNSGQAVQVMAPPKEQGRRNPKKKLPASRPSENEMKISGLGFAEVLARSTAAW